MNHPRSDAVAPAVLVAVALLAGVLAMTPWMVGGLYDDGMYVVLARSLATGEGYRYLNIPGAPRATHFPPGYPAFLALLWQFWPSFPANVALFKLANAVLMALAALGSWELGRRALRLGAWPAAAVAAVFTISIPVLILSSAVMSEMLFLALLVPAILLAGRVVDDGGWRAAVWAGLLTGAVMLVRSVGIALVPAALLALASRRRWREAGVYLSAVVLLVGPWQAWVAANDWRIPAAIAPSYGAYAGWIAEAVSGEGAAFVRGVLARNLAGLGRIARAILSPVPVGVAAWVFVAGVAALFVGGLWRLRHRAPVLALFVVLYLALIVAWPYGPDRFVFAIWPLVGLVLAAGAAQAWDWRERPATRVPAALLAGVALATVVAHTTYGVRGARGHYWDAAQRAGHRRALPLVAWATDHAPPRAVLSVEADPLVYLYSGRRAVPQVQWRVGEYLRRREGVETAGDMEAIFRTFSPDFLLVRDIGSNTQVAALAFIQRHPTALQQVGTLPDGGAVFRVRPQVAAP
ncbi:MAG TPA: glycosyltransferase family 39 protein [Gemmatimonadaceae bacterium]